jgi:hypothetical protein
MAMVIMEIIEYMTDCLVIKNHDGDGNEAGLEVGNGISLLYGLLTITSQLFSEKSSVFPMY